jgi:hypothetical protein
MAEEWYYAREGEEFGPVSAVRLKQLAASGQLQPTDLIWKIGSDKRVPARTVKGLWGNGSGTTPKAPAPAPARPSPPRRQPSDEDLLEVTPEDADEDDRSAPGKKQKSKKGGTPVWVWIIGGASVFLCCCVGMPTGGYFVLDYYGSKPFGGGGGGDSRLSLDSVKKVKAGMSLKEVEGILGPGRLHQEIRQGNQTHKVMKWGEPGKEVFVTLIDDRVLMVVDADKMN